MMSTLVFNTTLASQKIFISGSMVESSIFSIIIKNIGYV